MNVQDVVVVGAAPTGSEVAAMVDERGRLLGIHDRTHPEVDALTRRLAELLSSNRAVRALDPAGSARDRALAEDLALREAVHPPGSAEDRDRRLARDRRVFVIEHPLLEERPMNVLWVALCESPPDALGAILDADAAEVDPTRADTAVFYSIWNAEAGLAGIGAGKDLVSGASVQLRDELPGLTTLTTMSPIPGFREWYDGAERDLRPGPREAGVDDLGRACARYLLDRTDDAWLTDPVARFHMGSGARLWRLLPGADPSERGLQRSFGMMVNYRYLPEDLSANAQATKHGRPPLGHGVAALLEDDGPSVGE